ncbi:hypothetical protein KIW84_042673 [Lathyrus oleraceus]|uniref:Gag-pro-like protein n=1 Tax=Pisum sativum TaxID=3888 RepID=A0A9D4XDA8_PEA|nr:hypothetical protein KIW84_042673 [Pisum sativum]
MAPDRDQLRAMSQKDKEAFKDYAQRWREVATQIVPPLEEKEMTKIFLKTLSSFYYERIIASAPSDITEMVNMGMRLEEGVREGCLTREEGSSTKRYGKFGKKKNGEAHAVTSHVKPRRPSVRRKTVRPTDNQHQHRPQQQAYQPRNSNQASTSYERKRVTFGPIPMTAPRHDVENCYPLKTKVQDLVRCGILCFEDVCPNVKKNPLTDHGKSVNMVQGCPGKYTVKYVSHIRQSLVRKDVQEMLDEGVIEILQNRNVDEDADEVNVISPVFRIPEPVIIKYYGSKKKVSPALIIKPADPVPYYSEKAVPYRYNVVALENGKEVPLPSSSVVNIADVSGLTRSGRVFLAPPKPQADVRRNDNVGYAERRVGNAMNAPNPALVVKPASTLKTSVSVGPSGNAKEDCDEMLRLIKRSEYNVVDQLLQTPSKIFVLSLMMNSEPHREAMQKVLDVAYVDHDVTIEKFDSIVANITACNNLSFCDADDPEEGRDHNLALHISMSGKDDAMSNVLVDTGSSLNVLPKTTLAKLSYQGPPMRQSGVVVKAFDGSRKTVIGEVDLLVKIGPSDFQITFQVMDNHPSYSCLLGRPWIHEAGAVTSTLHQKLKFVKNKKLVVVGGEKDLLVSHLSSFSYIDVEDEVGTPFQALSIAEPINKGTSSFASYKDAKLAIEHGAIAGLGQMIELKDNKSRAGIGYSSGVFNKKGLFKSGGFIHTGQDEEVVAILEEDEEDSGNFIIHGGVCNNWVAVDIPTVIHKSK